MPQHKELPFDVLEKIIDTIGADDTPMSNNLKPFSLTCKSLLHSCRKHIFKTIIIGLPVRMDDIDEDELDDDRDLVSREIPPSRLCWLMSTQPQFSEYVRVFKFGVSGDPSTYCIDNPDFSRVLRRFTQLQSFTLDVQYDSGHEENVVEWADIPRPIQDTILFLVRLPTLTSLTMRNQRIPLFRIELADNLHCLRIDDVAIPEEENGPMSFSDRIEPIVLHEYSAGYSCVDTTSAILKAGLPDNRDAFDFSELRHLRADIYSFPEDVDAARDVISRTAQLRTLALTSEAALLYQIRQRANTSLHSPHQPWVLCPVLRRPHHVPQYTHAD
ncbi:hypothetical protein HYPSUDRAFT_293388 [Hypholoma sublateritium FD-334 SS-4]|uniref:F-box domain-containing protein n=1 Tax=Hypholoma sublateritium (strain FD-334 SS-4) TaxID=945553 RepID=A0A0D2KPB3_HYPSF|nr:hypothetical protein HYPSUDRAFT_293388 [Hypholoma sublateritium FD-334 SS-4]